MPGIAARRGNRAAVLMGCRQGLAADRRQKPVFGDLVSIFMDIFLISTDLPEKKSKHS